MPAVSAAAVVFACVRVIVFSGAVAHGFVGVACGCGRARADEHALIHPRNSLTLSLSSHMHTQSARWRSPYMV